MARAQAGTIRLKLLKIGAVILRNTRRVRFHLGSACPDKVLFMSPPPDSNPDSRRTPSRSAVKTRRAARRTPALAQNRRRRPENTENPAQHAANHGQAAAKPNSHCQTCFARAKIQQLRRFMKYPG